MLFPVKGRLSDWEAYRYIVFTVEIFHELMAVRSSFVCPSRSSRFFGRWYLLRIPGHKTIANNASQ